MKMSFLCSVEGGHSKTQEVHSNHNGIPTLHDEIKNSTSTKILAELSYEPVFSSGHGRRFAEV